MKAGPGSGKTTCVAKRLAEKHVEWKYFNRGIVTISFTNVAWKKIEDILSKQFNINISAVLIDWIMNQIKKQRSH